VAWMYQADRPSTPAEWAPYCSARQTHATYAGFIDYRAMSTAEPAPYQGGPLGAHMHDPSATRPDEVGTMIGKWLKSLSFAPRVVVIPRRTEC
jgi:hypothetical protein